MSKLSSGKPVHNPNLPPRTATGRPAQMPMPPAERPKISPPGGAIRGTMEGTAWTAPSRQINENKGMVTAKPPAPARSHLSQEVRSELGKLNPAHAAEIRRVAGTK